MIFYLTSRIIGSVAAFLYPGYASYKTLSQRPASEEELERWLMYWSVLGCIVSLEYVAEWFVSWIPFYYLVKTIFLLYLALPQTSGASYLYKHHLQPFFHSHESQIDATLASFKVRLYTFIQDRMRALWDHILTAVRQHQQTATGAVAGQGAAGAGPAAEDATPGPTQLALNFWRSYGPSIIATGAALLRQAPLPTTTTASTSAEPWYNAPAAVPPVPAGSTITTQSLQDRRRELEAQLAALARAEADSSGNEAMPAAVPIPMLGSAATFTSSRTSSSSDIRERTASAGKFEEIDMPSELEGYDVGRNGVERGSGPVAGPSGVEQQRMSWFNWGGNQTKGGYERVKSE